VPCRRSTASSPEHSRGCAWYARRDLRLGLGPERGRRWRAAAGPPLVARGALGGRALDISEARRGQDLRRGGVRLDVPGREPQRKPQVVRFARLRQPREGA
jgi:hypothetical protein